MQGLSLVEMVEELFIKMRKEFGEFDEESRKVDELRVLKQGGRTCNEYIQIFKKRYQEKAAMTTDPS